MAISSDSLFHYTRDFTIIKNIIRDGFKISLCMESHLAFPMISFCDIPLSQAKYYLTNYGSYALGMKTAWGIKNGLNPVIYLEDDSNINRNLKNAMKALKAHNHEFGKDKKDDLNIHNLHKYIIDTVRYSKPYKGNLIRENIDVENYKFYDEREWRYIPDSENKYFPIGLSPEEYFEFKKKNTKKPHFEENGLKFTANDIKYIILKEESEIPHMIDFLMNLSHLGSPKDVQLLYTKILLSDQILEDV